MFVAIEGLDGSGKTTVSEWLAAKLDGSKLIVFPAYGTPIGKLIKDSLAGRWVSRAVLSDSPVPQQLLPDNLNALVLQGLMAANRLEVADSICAHVDDVGPVVAARYWQSGYAYGKADGIDGAYLRHLHAYLPQPDLNILLDIDLCDSLTRRPERADAYERDEDRLREAARNYRELWRERSSVDGVDRWVTINARQDLEGVKAQVWTAVKSYCYFTRTELG